MTNEPQVVISNVFGDENRGGTAITSVAISLIESRLPGTYITLVPIVPSGANLVRTHRHVAALHPSAEITEPLIREWPGFLGRVGMIVESAFMLALASSRGRPGVARVRAAGLVVGKGGQVFKMRRGAGSLLAFWMDVFPLVLARRMKVPAAVFSVTVGPYEDRSIAKWLASAVLRRLQLVVVRDDRSARAARELGVKPDCLRVAPDSVFAIRLPTQAESDAAKRLVSPAAGRYGVVTVLPWKEFDDVAGVVIDALRTALDEGYVDQIVAVVQTTTDRDVTERLVITADDPRFAVVDEDLSPGELVALYGGARFVVAGRMHSAILALVAGTPAHPIRPKGLDKASEMLDVVGLADLVCHVDALARPLADSLDHLRLLLRRDCEHEGDVRARVGEAMRPARVQVEEVADELVALHRCNDEASAVRVHQ